jgi:hypothetical protein
LSKFERATSVIAEASNQKVPALIAQLPGTAGAVGYCQPDAMSLNPLIAI